MNVLEDIILELSLPDKEHIIDSLRTKECEFQKTSDNYIEKTQIFIDFLNRTKTKESESELTFTNNEYERTKTIIDCVQRDIKKTQIILLRNIHHRHHQFKTRIVAEKERIQLDFMIKQAELKKQRAALKENKLRCKLNLKGKRKKRRLGIVGSR
ncbi:hypothetical protein SNE40_013041 [Patella caerulea]|uniref:Uncharacterized protein n=1 Tax=Patella caerulea TaxID=87958 RepID=A0AAN8JLI4_PATCE